ncbi:MAG: AAA family ATPase [Rubrivivax sp.]|nr:AAA family ATPase [Rubrivivax sp.]
MPLRGRAAQLLWPDSPKPRQNLRQQMLRFRQTFEGGLIEGEDHLRLAGGVALADQPSTQAELLAGEPGSDEGFGLWLAQHRGRDQQARREPILAALAQAEGAGELDAALVQAQALLALEPQAETHHITLMRLHYLRGEADAGLQVYPRLVDLLRRKLGSAPGPAAQQLAGREAALDTLRQARRQGLRVLVEGEADMGKSRLLTECWPLHTPGVLKAAGRPGDAGLAYATLARLLAPVLTPMPCSLGPLARRDLAWLGAGDTPPPDERRPLGPQDMAHAVGELLLATGTTAAVLDDLHFADAATLELLTGLAAADDSWRQWLFAQRPSETPAVARQLREALAIPDLHCGTLAPALVQHTGGNPFFTLETLKQGLVDASLAQGRLPRPLAVGTLIEQRLSRLSEPALNLARVAAIAGVDFDIELAEAAIGQSAVQLASAWRELQAAQVLRDESFVHDLVAETVLRSVPRVVARRVHALCAPWLEARGCEPARVARHWQQGGLPLRAAQAFEQAADRAAHASRSQEAAELQGLAADQFELAGEAALAFEARVHRLNALTHGQGRDEVLAEAAALHQWARTDLQRVQALRVEIDLLANRGHTERALDQGLQAMALAPCGRAERCPPTPEAAAQQHQHHLELAALQEQRLAEAARLRALARSQELHGLELSCLAWPAQAGNALGLHDAAAAAARAAQDLLDRGYWPTGLGRTELHALLWQAMAEAGRAEAACQALCEGLAWLQQQALPHVPPQFVESFMHRHPVHRRLPAAASRL